MKKILFVGGTTGGGVATINNEVVAIFRGVGFRCHQLDTEKLKAKYPVVAAYMIGYLQLLWNIFKIRPQIVYLQCAQTGYLHQSLFLLLAKLTGRETIAHFHAKANLKESCTILQFRKILFSRYYIDKMILLTVPCRSSLTHNGWDKPTFVVPNFINTDELPVEISPVRDREQILYLGRMDEEKGIFDILEIARRLPSEKFVFVGNFSDSKQEQKFTAEIGTLPNASWLGPMYDRRKYDVLAASKFLLFPTRRDEFPMTLIEATLLGCIPLVNLVGSVGEIIIDGFNGYFITPDDHDGIITLIQTLNANQDLQTISDNAEAYAREHFTSDGVKDHLLQFVG